MSDQELPTYTVGDPVRLLRVARKEYRRHTFTVRQIVGTNIAVDNGDPENKDFSENGATLAIVLSLSSDLEPWGDSPKQFTAGALLAGKLHREQIQAAEMATRLEKIASWMQHLRKDFKDGIVNEDEMLTDLNGLIKLALNQTEPTT